MIRALAALSCCFFVSCAGPAGPVGPEGPAGPPGPTGDAGEFMPMRSISSVHPTKLAVGVTADITISGYATSWTSTAQVTFGQGITVNAVRIGSPTGLVANVTVAANAMTGTRDVTVTQGSVMSTFAGVFTLVPLFETQAIGMATRGGGMRFEVRANDPEFSFPTNPADVTVGIDPAPMAGRITTTVSVPTPRLLAVNVGANLLATLARYTLTLSFAGRQIVLPPFDLGEKVELPLTDAAPITAVTLEPNEKKLIKYTGAAVPVEAAVHVSMGAGATNVQLVLLDASGEPVDTSGSGGLPGPGNDLVLTADVTGTYVLLSETAGTRTTNVTVTAVTTSVTETEPNDDSSTAQALTLTAVGADQGVRVVATSGDSSDLDWYKITVAAGDVGKRIHLRTYSLAYIWYDTQILGPTAMMFTTSDINNKTTDYYSPPLTAAGDYTIGLDPDTGGGYHFTLSLQ